MAAVAGQTVRFAECVACNFLNVLAANPRDLEIELNADEITVVYQRIRCPKCYGDARTNRVVRKINFTRREHECKSCLHVFHSIDL